MAGGAALSLTFDCRPIRPPSDIARPRSCKLTSRAAAARYVVKGKFDEMELKCFWPNVLMFASFIL